MILFFKILGLLLFLMFIIIILLILIPVGYSVNYNISDKSCGEIKIKLLGGFLNIIYNNRNKKDDLKILICGFISIYIKAKNNVKNKDKKTKNREDKTKRFKFKNISVYFLRKLMSYILDIIESLKPKVLKIEGTFGFYDPSNTGIVCAFIPFVSNMLPSLDINLEPIFHDEILDINIICIGKVSFILAAFKTAAFLREKRIRKFLFG